MDYGIIKSLARERGIPLETIAKNAGISYNSLSKIIRNIVTEPKYTTMESIAHSLELTTDRLAFLVGLSKETKESANVNVTDTAQRIGRAYDNAPVPVKRTVEVALEPYMDTAPLEEAKGYESDNDAPMTALSLYAQSVAAGLGNYLDDDSYEMMEFANVPKRANIAVRISGDSMEPKFHDGDIVFVETDSILEEGEVGIFCCDGDGYIKVLRKNPLRLESLNEEYEDIVIQEGMQLYAIGRVVSKA